MPKPDVSDHWERHSPTSRDVDDSGKGREAGGNQRSDLGSDKSTAKPSNGPNGDGPAALLASVEHAVTILSTDFKNFTFLPPPRQSKSEQPDSSDQFVFKRRLEYQKGGETVPNKAPEKSPREKIAAKATPRSASSRNSEAPRDDPGNLQSNRGSGTADWFGRLIKYGPRDGSSEPSAIDVSSHSPEKSPIELSGARTATKGDADLHVRFESPEKRPLSRATGSPERPKTPGRRPSFDAPEKYASPRANERPQIDLHPEARKKRGSDGGEPPSYDLPSGELKLPKKIGIKGITAFIGLKQDLQNPTRAIVEAGAGEGIGLLFTYATGGGKPDKWSGGLFVSLAAVISLDVQVDITEWYSNRNLVLDTSMSADFSTLSFELGSDIDLSKIALDLNQQLDEFLRQMVDGINSIYLGPYYYEHAVLPYGYGDR